MQSAEGWNMEHPGHQHRRSCLGHVNARLVLDQELCWESRGRTRAWGVLEERVSLHHGSQGLMGALLRVDLWCGSPAAWLDHGTETILPWCVIMHGSMSWSWLLISTCILGVQLTLSDAAGGSHGI